jgi:exonuclease SbcC
MKPLRLTLQNFKGIKAGMGIDRLELDLSALPNGLVAVTGQNGAGKTTILDNLHPFRIQPYKLRESKEWSPGAFSYYDQCEGRDALKELVFEMDGKRYKSVIFIDAEKRKQECYLYREEFDGWVPYNNEVKAGKTKPYDEAVEQICGSPSLFFSSVFRSQDARKLSSYPRSEILNIVTELLNIDHIAEQGAKANEVSKHLAGIIADLEKRRLPIMDALMEHNNLMVREHNLQRQIAENTALIDAHRVNIKANEEQIHNLELAAAAETVTRQRREELIQQQTRLTHGITEKKREKENRLAQWQTETLQVQNDFNMVTADIQRTKARIIGEASDLYKEQDTLQALIERAAEIRKAAEDAEVYLPQLKDAQMALEKCRDDYQNILKEEKASMEIQIQISTVGGALRNEHDLRATEKQNLEADLRRAKSQAAILTAGLPCNGDENCPLLRNAITAKDEIAGIEAAIRLLEDTGVSIKNRPSISSIQAEMERLIAAAEQYIDLPAKKARCQADGQSQKLVVTKLQESYELAQSIASQLPKLEMAEARLVAITAQIKALEIQVEEQEAKHVEQSNIASTRHLQINTAQAQYEDEVAKWLEMQGLMVAALASEIDQLNATLNGNLPQQIAEIKAKITELQTGLTYAEQSLQANQRAIGGIQSQLADLERKSHELKDIESDIQRVQEEMVNWNLLARACSNDGVIALEIDDAGPAISSLTNELLRACYGSRFSVRLETQGMKADGGLKEVFDITVYDGERDEEKSIRDMSGGEVTWLEDSITRAFCLYNLHRSNRQYGTIFTDEKDGALDESRKTEFLAIKRRAMEIGHHTQEFFISQTQELVDRADARIVLQKGGVTIQ